VSLSLYMGSALAASVEGSRGLAGGGGQAATGDRRGQWEGGHCKNESGGDR